MKLDVPYKFLDIVPGEELLNFDFSTSITLEEWAKDSDLGKSLKQFSEMYNIPLIGTANWSNPTPSNIRFPINKHFAFHSIIMKEVVKLEQLYNATALIAALDGLSPGSKIYRHQDIRKIFQESHRVHLPLVTNEDVKFFIDDIEYHFPVGKFYEFDNSRFHEVHNNSNVFRIHLIIDLIPNNYKGE